MLIPKRRTATMQLVRRALRPGLVALLLAAGLVAPPPGQAEEKPMRFAHLSVDEGLSQASVLCIFQDRLGFVWLGTEDGLNRFDGHIVTVYKHDPQDPDSLPGDFVWSIAEDSSGDLWLGTEGGGLARWDRQRDRFTTYRLDPDHPHSLSGDRVRVVQVDHAGAVWVGTKGEGLNRLDPKSGEFARFRHDPADPTSLSHAGVYALHQDRGGRLWVGTDGGLNQPDGAGRLWLSTNMGLVRFDPRTETFRDYDRSHGLQGNEFNFGAHYRSPRGELFFGGPNGFNAFLPSSIPTNEHPPPVALTAFLNANRPVPTGAPPFALDRVHLRYQDDVVTFEFAALDYAAPERNHYAYQLEGFDPDWIDLESVHRVTYTDLDPGRYVLRVRAANNDGVWNDGGLQLPVTVAPPPWRTWWAYLVYASLLAVGLTRGFRAQRRRAGREAEYRRRLELEVEARTEELARQNDRLEALNEQLVETSPTDSLTGLRNRRFLFEEVGKEMSLVQRHHREKSRGLRDDADQLVFIMVDLDWFKPINDTCGHAAGDQVLVQVRQILESACRDSDVLIRWGGDEFLVVGRATDLEGIETAAERIRSVVESTTFDLGDGQVAHLTCSIGFICYPAGTSNLLSLSLEQVVSLADKALYAAKRAGRNAWVGLVGGPEAS